MRIWQESGLQTFKRELSKLLNQSKLKLRKVQNRDIYQKVIKTEQASDLIGKMISSGQPFMLTRFGATEMLCVSNYFKGHYATNTIASMVNNSGFFPGEAKMLDQFCELYLQSSCFIDVLGIWFLAEEAKVIRKYCPKAHLLYLEALEPYVHPSPWSAYLKGKKVLVIHPFSKTILENYHNRRSLLFKNQTVLPEFDLECIRSVQSLAGNPTQFATWFEAYDSMRDAIDQTNYDVAILGCGAYGLPLAAHIKSQGKQAIHLGGATQILFGIKGKRWDNMPVYQALYNEHWTRPLPEDFPENYQKPGGYWNYW